MIDRNFFMASIIFFLLVAGSLVTGHVGYNIGLVIWIIMFLNNKGRIIKKNTFFPYSPLLVYGIIISIINSANNKISSSDLVTGLIHLSNPILFLSIGALISMVYETNKFLKVVLYSGTVVGIWQLILLTLSLSSTDSINSLRMSMLPMPDILALSLFLLLYKKNFEIKLGKKMEIVMFIIILLSFIVTFSRTLILEFLALIAIFLFNKEIRKKSLIILFVFFSTLLLLFVTFQQNSIGNQFIQKVVSSSSETSKSNDWNQLSNITTNWRGYEVFSALNQFNMSNSYSRWFGEGLGSQIYIGPYGNYVGVKGMFIPYLHNSFYTLLIKVGIVGLVYYICFLMLNLFFYLKKSKNSLNYLLSAGLFIILIIKTQLMQGTVVMGRDVVILVILGYLVNRQEQ